MKRCTADQNVCGIDLWLNALSGGHCVRCLRYRLFTGNSLIGAPREVHPNSALKKRPKDGLWYKKAPRRFTPETLAHTYLFETPPPAHARKMRKYPAVPHPFVLNPPMSVQDLPAGVA